MTLDDRAREEEELLAANVGKLLNDSEKVKEIHIEGYPDLYCSRNFLDLLTEIIEMGGYPHQDIGFFRRNEGKLKPEHYEMMRRLPILPVKPRGEIWVGINCQRREPRRQPLPPGYDEK